MGLEYFIPFVILSWPGSNVPPEVIQGPPTVNIRECVEVQHQIMKDFTEKYPYFWNTTYAGTCHRRTI